MDRQLQGFTTPTVWSTLVHKAVKDDGTLATDNRFNRIRLVFYNAANTSPTLANPRIAQIGIVNYSSNGQRCTYMSRGIDDYLFRNITPNSTNTYNIGSSTYKWRNLYLGTQLQIGNTTINEAQLQKLLALIN